MLYKDGLRGYLMVSFNPFIFDIQRNSLVDGPGMRMAIFLKGCSLSCQWCHNPEALSACPTFSFQSKKCSLCMNCVEICPKKIITWDHSNRPIIDMNQCDFCQKCMTYCFDHALTLYGKAYTQEELLTLIQKDACFFSRTQGGVTFSGGEAMLYTEFLRPILKKLKAQDMHIAIDTAGHVAWRNFESIRPYVDLFLYDLKIGDPDLHQYFTGHRNELIIQNLKKLDACGQSIWIRIPLIPTIHDDDMQLSFIVQILNQLKYRHKIELLPFHQMAKAKYTAIGMDYFFDGQEEFSVDQAQKVQAYFAANQIITEINH